MDNWIGHFRLSREVSRVQASFSLAIDGFSQVGSAFSSFIGSETARRKHRRAYSIAPQPLNSNATSCMRMLSLGVVGSLVSSTTIQSPDGPPLSTVALLRKMQASERLALEAP